jgi:hypothetical protein
LIVINYPQRLQVRDGARTILSSRSNLIAPILADFEPKGEVAKQYGAVRGDRRNDRDAADPRLRPPLDLD